jgi:hypothetical protein
MVTKNNSFVYFPLSEFSLKERECETERTFLHNKKDFEYFVAFVKSVMPFVHSSSNFIQIVSECANI